MRATLLVTLVLAISPALPAQTNSDDVLDIYTEHPRLFLRPQRLRMLQRERERHTARWGQFETLLVGRAPMPEMGFAQALYFQISGDKEAGNRAVTWALTPANTDLRQLAIVFDWCQTVLTDAQSKTLTAKMVRLIAASERNAAVPAIRDRTLAAVALAGHQQDVSNKQIEWLVRAWWTKEIAPGIKSGKEMIPRDAMYALFEILHAVRDNTNVELRDALPAYFKALPSYHLISHYPATFQAPENEYRIPVIKGAKEPDTDRATVSRAAELAMVAYDTNAQETQLLQGWLMLPNFQMRGMLGSVYEFMWANPYQPGLSYYHMPLVLHDTLFGRLFMRSSWEESAKWVGYFGDELQIFEDGRPSVLNPQLSFDPIPMPEAVVMAANYAKKFHITLQEGSDAVYVVALKPRQAYDVEVDDEEMREETTDPGGILKLQLPSKIDVGVRMREAKK